MEQSSSPTKIVNGMVSGSEALGPKLRELCVTGADDVRRIERLIGVRQDGQGQSRVEQSGAEQSRAEQSEGESRAERRRARARAEQSESENRYCERSRTGTRLSFYSMRTVIQSWLYTLF